jgi:hypothetical protein
MAIEGSGSLRDVVETAVNDKAAAIEAEALPPVETPQVEAKVDERPRGPDGKFIEKSKEPAAQASAKATIAKAPTPTPSSSPSQAPALSATPAAPKIQRPSTWKKDHWESFDKLATENPALAAYINQREGEYAKGVSTYKQEWDRAKPILDALAPYMPLLEQHKMQPAPWIASLAESHRQLALGSPEQKAARFVQLAREYQIPIESLFVQGQDGRLYPNPNLSAAQQSAQQQGLTVHDVERIVSERSEQQRISAEITAFASQKEQYPHYEEVRETMAGLLQAGLAADLPSAYEAALRMPAHFHLFEAQQEQQRVAAEKEKAEQTRKAAEAARKKAASVRGGAPTGAAAGADGKKSLRDVVTGAVEERLGAGRL